MIKIFFTISFLFSLVSCNNNTGDKDVEYDSTIVNTLPAPQPITFTIDSVYPHDKEAFTQGLQFYKGKLYESTGLPEKSSLRIVNIKTGKPEKTYLIPDAEIFGEGITIFQNKIYQLTWENNKVFVYNISNITKPIQTLNWQRQGWGITNDGNNLIISDGSDKLYYVRHDETKNELQLMKIVSVSDNTGPVDSLNELEYINGYIYANVWFTNDIVKIDTGNGHVVGKINLTGLLQQYAPSELPDDSSVLNGIAYDSTTKKMYITGKNWPKMFEMRLN
jgi:glutamine cyclotransferase